MERLSAESASAGAALLDRHGCCWLDEVLSSTELIPHEAEARASFASVLSAVGRQQAEQCRGLPERLHRMCRMPVKTAEVVERDGGRFDCRHGLDTFGRLLEAREASVGVARLVALLEAALGPELMVVAHGQVVALGVDGRASYMCTDGGDMPQV